MFILKFWVNGAVEGRVVEVSIVLVVLAVAIGLAGIVGKRVDKWFDGIRGAEILACALACIVGVVFFFGVMILLGLIFPELMAPPLVSD